ncbi:enoyl-CoA hydratase/isomerase family protein [Erwinia persicina]|uniref:enoyl-CoA hydratase/isomerase family protein n=1 Tax=Erwinia persicina TaxID=55211 RepID=UPI00210EE76A|nr:enoyl-CoA hydratase/isomerase family protein [Erwinia persicina]MCQ4094971.1 enoyl-CoA hydratase/isomerase family protein [Erwinia persicina]MCQ4100064.1 enoyl-CoA hydratase/isomerase family protein [Erwinia persicina]
MSERQLNTATAFHTAQDFPAAKAWLERAGDLPPFNNGNVSGSDLAGMRDDFLRLHAASIYDHLTRQKTCSHRLTALIREVSRALPGMIPNLSMQGDESSAPSRETADLILAQAQTVNAFLSDPSSGLHLLSSMRRPAEKSDTLIHTYASMGRVILPTLKLQRIEGIGYITLLNQSCLNAEDLPLLADLEAAVDLVLMDEQTRTGVLRGGIMTHPRFDNKRVFCSGLNLKALSHGQIPLIEYVLSREMGLMNKLMHGLLQEDDSGALHCIRKPWIAAVDSFAIGGGLQLLLAVDCVIAESDAWFSLPAAREGFVPGLANLRLTRFTGARLARKLILGGHVIRATDSDADRLCDYVVPAENMESTIASCAAILSEASATANLQLLCNSEETQDMLRLYLAEFALVQAKRMISPEVTEKAKAFVKQRGVTA